MCRNVLPGYVVISSRTGYTENRIAAASIDTTAAYALSRYHGPKRQQSTTNKQENTHNYLQRRFTN